MIFFAPSSAPRRRRRPAHTPFRPVVDGLEDRVVMSTATLASTSLLAPAEIHALATTRGAQLRLPTTISGVNITSLTRDATGVLNLVGNLTGTILGQAFTSPVTGTITPARNAKACPILNLTLQPIHLSLLGLNVDTSTIHLNITAHSNRGVLGSLLCGSGGLPSVLSSATGGDTAGATTQLNTLLSNIPLKNALNQALAQARPRLTSVTPSTGTTCPVLNLTLGPVNLNLLGLNVKLDNGANKPVQVRVSATQGGGILGDLVCGITATRGGALTRQATNALAQIAATHIPTPLAMGGTKTPPTPGVSAQGDPVILQLDLKPLDVNLLGLEVKTSEIIVTVSAQPGSGKLLGNLLTTVSNLINTQGVNTALNNVLANVVTLANGASLSVSGVGSGFSNAVASTVPVLTAHVAPVHLDLLGAVVDTSTIDVQIIAHSGPGLVLGNIVSALANTLNTPPKNGKLNLDYVAQQLHNLNNQVAALIPGIPASPFTPTPIPAGTNRVLSLNVAPINLNLLGLVLTTDQITVNADAVPGNGNLLGNLLTELLNTAGATQTNLNAVSNELSTLLSRVVGVLNASNLTLAPGAADALSQTLKTLALPTLVTAAPGATAPVLDLVIASQTSAPPVAVNLLGLVVTTSDVRARLVATTGDGQILGNLVYNIAHLLDPTGALALLPILTTLGV